MTYYHDLLPWPTIMTYYHDLLSWPTTMTYYHDLLPWATIMTYISSIAETLYLSMHNNILIKTIRLLIPDIVHIVNNYTRYLNSRMHFFISRRFDLFKAFDCFEAIAKIIYFDTNNNGCCFSLLDYQGWINNPRYISICYGLLNFRKIRFVQGVWLLRSNSQDNILCSLYTLILMILVVVLVFPVLGSLRYQGWINHPTTYTRYCPYYLR